MTFREYMNDQSAVGDNVKQTRINQEVQKIINGGGLNPREKELVDRIFQNPTASTYFWQLMQQSKYDIGAIMQNLRKVMTDKRKELELTKTGNQTTPPVAQTGNPTGM